VRIVAFVSVRIRVATSASTWTWTTMAFVVGSDAKRTESTEPIGTPTGSPARRLKAVRPREAQLVLDLSLPEVLLPAQDEDRRAGEHEPDQHEHSDSRSPSPSLARVQELVQRRVGRRARLGGRADEPDAPS
jgi:hypothetical protein